MSGNPDNARLMQGIENPLPSYAPNTQSRDLFPGAEAGVAAKWHTLADGLARLCNGKSDGLHEQVATRTRTCSWTGACR